MGQVQSYETSRAFWTRARRGFVAMCLAATLSACASVPLMTLPKLAALNPETMDMSHVELAVLIKDPAGLQKDTGQITVIVEHPDLDEPLEQMLRLNSNPEALTPYLRRQVKPGHSLERFKMTAQQEKEIEAFRARLLDLRENGGDKMHTTLSASVGICQMPSQPRFEIVEMTMYVRTNPQKDFYKLLKTQKISFADKDRSKMKMCE